MLGLERSFEFCEVYRIRDRETEIRTSLLPYGKDWYNTFILKQKQKDNKRDRFESASHFAVFICFLFLFGKLRLNIIIPTTANNNIYAIIFSITPPFLNLLIIHFVHNRLNISLY